MICVINAQGSHNLARDLGPAIDYHCNNGCKSSLEPLWAHLQDLSLQWLGEMLCCFAIGIPEILDTLLAAVVEVFVLDRVEQPHQGVYIIIRGENLPSHHGGCVILKVGGLVSLIYEGC